LKPISQPDPVEAAFMEMCDDLHINYIRPEKYGGRIDFYLPGFALYVEVKAWPCERLHDQLESIEAGKNAAMVLVGVKSVHALRCLLSKIHLTSIDI